jgi:hypothetical protein
MNPEPVLMDCEGNYQPLNLQEDLGDLGIWGHCQMCHAWVAFSHNGAAFHQRQDVLTMVARGDFG